MATNYCTTEEVKSDMGISSSTYDDLIEALIEAISDAIDEDCQREGRLYYRQVEELFDIVEDQRKYHPRETPVVSVSGYYLKDSNGAYVQNEDREVYAYGEYIEFDLPLYGYDLSIYNQSTLTNKLKALKTSSQVGFFEEGNIPKGLNMLNRQVAGQEFEKIQNKTSGELKSKKVGNYAVSFSTPDEKSDISQSMQTNGLYTVLGKYRKGLHYGLL